MAGGDVADQLAALLADIGHRQVGPHVAQGVEQADAQRVEQHPLDRDLRARGDQGGDQREGRGRRVARDADPRPGQPLARRQHDAPLRAGLGHQDLGAEAAQHALGVVAGRLGLDHLDAALGAQPGQQHSRLHLGRRLRQAIGDAGQSAALQGQRQPTARAAGPGRAHFAERLQHPVHRPPAQGGVAREGGGHLETGGRAHDQANPGARVAAVDDVRRLRETAPALYVPVAVAQPLDLRPEGAHGRGAAAHVLAFEQALDLGFALRERPQDEGAVRYGFVPWRADGPLQRTGARGGHLSRRHWMETSLRGLAVSVRGIGF